MHKIVPRRFVAMWAGMDRGRAKASRHPCSRSGRQHCAWGAWSPPTPGRRSGTTGNQNPSQEKRPAYTSRLPGQSLAWSGESGGREPGLAAAEPLRCSGCVMAMNVCADVADGGQIHAPGSTRTINARTLTVWGEDLWRCGAHERRPREARVAHSQLSPWGMGVRGVLASESGVYSAQFQVVTFTAPRIPDRSSPGQSGTRTAIQTAHLRSEYRHTLRFGHEQCCGAGTGQAGVDASLELGSISHAAPPSPVVRDERKPARSLWNVEQRSTTQCRL